MNILSKKLSFQLTPLLDLLLIVIFAQYMELSESTEQQQQSLRQQATVQTEALATANTQIERLTTQGQQLDQLAKNRETERDAAIENAKRREEQLGELVAMFFQLPEEFVEESLKSSRPAQQIRTPEEMEKLRLAFRKMARKNGREMIKHLLTYHELRKRCDIWEVHVAENGSITFTAAGQTHTFRAEKPERFATILFELYKSLPQPKDLVLVLLSFGDAKALPREAARQGLPQATNRMRADSNDRIRFEYAILDSNVKLPTAPVP